MKDEDDDVNTEEEEKRSKRRRSQVLVFEEGLKLFYLIYDSESPCSRATLTDVAFIACISHQNGALLPSDKGYACLINCESQGDSDLDFG